MIRVIISIVWFCFLKIDILIGKLSMAKCVFAVVASIKS
jgi:hypothetical protein